MLVMRDKRPHITEQITPIAEEQSVSVSFVQQPEQPAAVAAGSRGSYKHVGTKVSTGRRKQTPPERAVHLFDSLLKVLGTEWKGIRSLNLGRPACMHI